MGSAAGRDGFWPQYYKDVLDTPSGATSLSLLSLFTSFHNLCLDGSLPADLAPFIASAKSVPLRKKDLNAVRPIAVGEADRRVTSKLALWGVRAVVAELLQTTQVGVGISNGAEAIVHSLQYLLDSGCFDDDDTFLLQVDNTNAFNLVDRSSMLQQVKLHCPDIYPWVAYCYSQPSRLYVGLEGHPFISIYAGIQQGDPLGPLLYALVQYAFIANGIVQFRRAHDPLFVPVDPDGGAEEHKMELDPEALPAIPAALLPHGGLQLNAWYLDDGSLVGSSTVVRWWLRYFLDSGPAYGIHLNLAASVIWSPSHSADFTHFPVELSTRHGAGVCALGAYIGSSVYVDAEVRNRVLKIKSMIDLLPDFNSSSLAYNLLQCCVGMPRFNYRLRVHRPDSIAGSIAAFDRCILSAVRLLFGNCQLTAVDMLRLTLPLQSSGFGICLASDVAPAAYVGSVYHSVELQASLLHHASLDLLMDHYSATALPLINALLPADKHVFPPKRLASSEPQHMLSSLCAASKLQRLQDDPSLPSFLRAVISACRLPGSGTWLLHLPAFGSRMNNLEWQVSSLIRLGKPIYTRAVACPCCHELLDEFGIHGCYCSGCGGALDRHNLTRDRLAGFMKAARISHHKETGFLLTATHSGPKPADIYLPHWLNGRAACVDVTIANSVSTWHANRPFDAMDPLHDAENSKFSKYEAACADRGLTLIPFVVGSHGSFNDHAVSLIKEVGSAWSLASDLSPSVAVATIRRSLIYEVQLAQARSLIVRGQLAGVMA